MLSFEKKEPKKDDVELLLKSIDQKVEYLKSQYTLFFAGELKLPPEQERENLEKQIRNLLVKGSKSPRLSLLIQNVSSKFTLYNNLWMKKLNDIEGGLVQLKRKPSAYMEAEAEPKKKSEIVDVSLNSEESFDAFFEKYNALGGGKKNSDSDKEKIINSVKTKLITSNLIDVKIGMQVENGKVRIKIKK